MALQPFADYFNHVSSPSISVSPSLESSPAATSEVDECLVSFSSKGYTITTPSSQAIASGSELFISYGSHSNDFLLVEYGFILPSPLTTNASDDIPLDAHILTLFTTTQKEKLEEFEFIGKYTLARDGVCYRTQVAMSLLCLPVRKWENFVKRGDGGQYEQTKVDALLIRVLRGYQQEARGTIQKVARLVEGTESQRETLGTRWKQIDLLLQNAIDRLQS